VGMNRDPHYRRNDDWKSMTLDEYRAVDATRRRPITDAPIGGWTSSKRDTDGVASKVWTEAYQSPIPLTLEHGRRCVCARCCHDASREAERQRHRDLYHRPTEGDDAA
jgi:hypothetical protein